MNHARSVLQYLMLMLKGVLMGAADAVPGVSGGTVAFMTGIYEELIDSLRRFGPTAVKILFTKGPVAAWHYVNGNFLAVLIAGVLISILTLAHSVLFLLDTYPEMLWSFFFGLILASSWLVLTQIGEWNSKIMGSFVTGALAAYAITSLAPASVEPTMLTFFLSGMLAICAMILPGISGSFILLLLGMYTPIMTAVTELNVVLLGLFAAGCGIGLLSFSHVLNWMFTRFHNLTLALLGGFLVGSLNKVWPWKYTISYTINRHGEQVPLVQDNVSPQSYQALTGMEAYLWQGVVLALLGIAIVVVLAKVSEQKAG
ncbi:MAG: DUF368 domain-containing protein [Pontibacterium sp.]